MATNSQKAYALHVKSIIDGLSDDLNKFEARVIILLRQASDRVVSKLARVPTGSWSTWHYEVLSKDIKGILADFNAKYDEILQSAIELGAKTGIQTVTTPLAGAINMNVFYGSPDIFVPAFRDEWTMRLVNLSKTKIKDALGNAEMQIMQEIMVGMMGDLPQYETIQKIADALTGQIGGSGARAGFRSVNDRALTIFRTETMKVNNLATEMQGQYAFNEFGGRGDKMWLHGVFHSKSVAKQIAKMSKSKGRRFYTPRLGHEMLSETTVPWDGVFTNTITMTQLRFPHDPDAGAGENINCGCSHYFVPPKDMLLTEKQIVSLAI